MKYKIYKNKKHIMISLIKILMIDFNNTEKSMYKFHKVGYEALLKIPHVFVLESELILT